MSYTSPKSSVESKSITPEALQSSWIRRLNLRPTSPSSHQPVSMAIENPPSETPPPTSGNSPSTTESRTPTSMFDANTNLFIHRLLKLRNEKNAPPRTEPETETETNSVVGFGPFQVQTSKRVSSFDAQAQPTSWVKLPETDSRDNHFRHESGFGDVGFARQDSVARINDGWHSRIMSSQTKTGLGLVQKDEQENRFPTNRTTTTLFNGETMSSSSESNFIMENNNISSRRSEKMDSFPVCGDRSLSPFFRYWTSLKKNEYQGDSMNRNGSFVGDEPSAGVENKDNTVGSCYMNQPWPFRGEKRDERLYEPQPMNQMGMARASHEGTSYYQNCGDGAAGRTSVGFHPINNNAERGQNEKHALATCPNEREDASSLLNMNTFQRAEMVSSIFKACRTGTRKRNSNPYEFFTGKSRKLSPDEG